jgi:hypothetical protein
MTVRCEIVESRRETGKRSREDKAYRGPVALEMATGGQYVEGLSSEHARLAAENPRPGLSQQ